MVDKDLVKKDSRYYESFLRRVLNKILVLLLKIISFLPFPVLYLISDCMYVVLRYVVRYRKKVIFENLSYAFPEKTEEEIKAITGKFYRHFCDFSLETVKLHSMTVADMEKRVKIKGLEIGNAIADEGKSMITLGFHYSNWEWGSYLQAKSKHKLLMVYSPLRGNSAMEHFILHSREKWGGESIPIHKIARALLEYMKNNIPSTLWLASDQTPPADSPFWTYFLNREAPFFIGPEKIAIKTNQPIVFVYMKKTGRGHYEANVELLIKEPGKLQHKDILLAYIRKMEEIIHEAPELYLWSHRRWKHKRPENIELTL
ncbi:lipid A biosynthesis acyltransferase [Maribellus luteus]|uniref:Lipid A biosynthesis acyltransferase n=1 Tax=Maribellus luteus TaxID=2305463 RepID=A0A399SZD7_9BACT|nr:lysophospholipid acyltransferase family protein [Maribellus luteus]RIJ47327.1 lipid A biosynthesis acyltransferase [Maribellus luteus]